MVYGSVYGSYIQENALADVEPFEFDESMSFMEMGAQTIEESTENWNNMMKAIALTELSYVAETGQELIYEAVDFGSIKDKVVGWFKKLWAKIKGIATAALAKFASFGKDDEKFINKYKSYFSDGYNRIPDGFSFKGYKFDDSAIKGAPSTVEKNAKAAINHADFSVNLSKGSLGDKASTAKTLGEAEKYDEMLARYRRDIASASTPINSDSEFTKAINKTWRGSDSKVYLNKSNIGVNKLIEYVSGCKPAIDAAKEGESTLKDSIDECIDRVNEAASKYSDLSTKEEISSDDAGLYRGASTAFVKSSEYLKRVEQVNATWYSNYIRVLKDRNRQAKALLVKLVSYANGVGGKKDPTNEAASILEDRFAAIFD